MLMVDQTRCVGCGLCVYFCPTDALRAWGVCRIARESCNECLACIDYCPADALREAAAGPG
jgi:NAD-dependent dihydropyrimidine dehydrogenase PreA subunit